MRLTVPHRFDFGADSDLVGDDLLRPEAWDSLRIATDGPFGLPSSAEAFRSAADARTEIAARMAAVDTVLAQRDVQHVVSYGVGVAIPEAWLHRLNPRRRLTATDFGPRTVERLRKVFPEVEVVQHDLLSEDPLPADLHLFHRIDTEFTDDEWRGIFRRFARDRIVLVATGVLTVRSALSRARHARRNSAATHAGWLRTRGSFEALWRETHNAERRRFEDLDGWILEPR